MPTAFLSLGSNLGDRAGHLAFARDRMTREFHASRFSPVYETEPVGWRDQPWFLNQVAEVRTELDPDSLLQWARRLESERGRIREFPQGPRTLDVDLLLYDDRVMNGPALTLPHPRLLERRFVLTPLSDLAPDRRIPPDGLPVRAALERLADDLVVRPL